MGPGHSPRMRICVMDPCRPKSIQSGCEAHTQLHAWAAALVVAEVRPPSGVDHKAEDVAAVQGPGHAAHGPELLAVHQGLGLKGRSAAQRVGPYRRHSKDSCCRARTLESAVTLTKIVSATRTGRLVKTSALVAPGAPGAPPSAHPGCGRARRRAARGWKRRSPSSCGGSAREASELSEFCGMGQAGSRARPRRSQSPAR